MFLPPAFLAAALIFARHRKLWIRIVWTGLAVLSSLPIGIAAVFLPTEYMTFDPRYEHSPGIGVAAIPLMLGWVVAILVWFSGSALAVVGRMPISSRRSN
jgi:hypothetical protein